MALLALLVWFLNPRQPDLKPASLSPPSEKCLNPGRDFVPTNLVSISNPELDALPPDGRNRAVHDLNATPCTCGCQLSVALCRGSNSHCETSAQMLKKILSESKNATEKSAGRK
jgi:hypothetical protein